MFQAEQQFTPALFAFAITIENGDQFFATVRPTVGGMSGEAACVDSSRNFESAFPV